MHASRPVVAIRDTENLLGHAPRPVVAMQDTEDVLVWILFSKVLIEFRTISCLYFNKLYLLTH